MNKLALKNITLRRKKKTICENFSLSFSPGIYSLLGPNGSGKSSLLLAIAQHIPLSSGAILFNESNLKTLPLKHRARVIGVLPQTSPIHLTCSVFDFILTGRFPYYAYFASASKEDKKITKEIIELFELSSLASRSIDTLSGGELQRVKIACILAQDPSIIILDEPCNHLDIRYQYILLKYLKHLTQTNNKIILISSHNYEGIKAFSMYHLLLFPERPLIIEGTVSQTILASLYNLT